MWRSDGRRDGPASFCSGQPEEPLSPQTSFQGSLYDHTRPSALSTAISQLQPRPSADSPVAHTPHNRVMDSSLSGVPNLGGPVVGGILRHRMLLASGSDDWLAGRDSALARSAWSPLSMGRARLGRETHLPVVSFQIPTNKRPQVTPIC